MGVASFFGDLAHLAAYLILIFRIESSRSCVGFSGRMQVLNLASALSQGWNFFYEFFLGTVYRSFTKLTFMMLAVYSNYIIFFKHRKTYEKRCDTFWIESIILTSITLSFIFHIQDDTPPPEEISRVFGLFVESGAIVPQIYFCIIKNQKVAAVTYYVMALTIYVLFVIMHSIIHFIHWNDFDTCELYAGIIQFLLYIVYFFLPKGKEEELPICRNVPHKFITQESLLESPLLKRCATANSIYIIGMDSSCSTLSRSISSDTQSTCSSSNTARF